MTAGDEVSRRGFRGGFHDYTIPPGGLAFYPRSSRPSTMPGSLGRIQSGVAALDSLLGGGPVPGTSTLLMGPAGSGKTFTATCCLLAALERGDPAAVFMFDEELGTFFARSASLGMDLRPHLAQGAFRYGRSSQPSFRRALRPLCPPRGRDRWREGDRDRQPQRLPPRHAQRAVPAAPDARVAQLPEPARQVALLVLGQHGLVGEVRSDVDLSYLSDTIILMRFFEAAGEVHQDPVGGEDPHLGPRAHHPRRRRPGARSGCRAGSGD